MMLLLLPCLLWLPPPSSSLLGDGACTAFMVKYNPALQIWLGGFGVSLKMSCPFLFATSAWYHPTSVDGFCRAVVSCHSCAFHCTDGERDRKMPSGPSEHSALWRMGEITGGNGSDERERGMIQLGEERELSNCAREQCRTKQRQRE